MILAREKENMDVFANQLGDLVKTSKLKKEGGRIKGFVYREIDM